MVSSLSVNRWRGRPSELPPHDVRFMSWIFSEFTNCLTVNAIAC